MKGRKIIALLIVTVMVLGSIQALAIDYEVPEHAATLTARFDLMDEETDGDVFSMISEDDELIIHINEDTIIYFEDFVLVRDTLEEGQTLAEVLDGRLLVVTHAVVTASIPPQTSPISIKVMFETAVPLPQPAGDLPFEDVAADDWFYDAVVWAFENDIMNGLSDTVFAPNATMTRAMLVTVLWRYAGEPEAGEPTFNDVLGGRWYSTAVAWANENGIVLGESATIFNPTGQINREQMYTILYRYMNEMGLTVELDDEMGVTFADEDAISEWAMDAVHFMYNAGIMFRLSDQDNNARPRDNAIRGEIAGAMFFFDMLTVEAEDAEDADCEDEDCEDAEDGDEEDVDDDEEEDEEEDGELS